VEQLATNTEIRAQNKTTLKLLTQVYVIALISLFSQSCVANQAYRWTKATPPVNASVNESVDGMSSNFKISYLEFDDMGEFWTIGDLRHFDNHPNASQLSEILDFIRKQKEDQRDLVVVTFIHGWHNNASKYDEGQSHDKSLGGFESLLRTRAERDPNRFYLGIFIAWRGQALAADPFFTYWNRRDAAMRVSSPSLSEAVFRLMFAANGIAAQPELSNKCKSADLEPSKTQFIIIGHSFGARILENAVAQPFLTMLLEREAQTRTCIAQAREQGIITNSEQGSFRSPADMIVLLNSANDAFRTKSMIEGMKRLNLKVVRQTPGTLEKDKNDILSHPASSMDSYGPLILSITSKGDWATGRVMPVAQAISSADKSFRSYDSDGEQLGQEVDHSQEFYYLHNEGNVPEFLTHNVRRISTSACVVNHWPYFMGEDGCYLVEPEHRWNDTPFWVMKVSKHIIPNHTDIFELGLVDLLESVLDRYAASSSETHLSVQ
jgi:hypothetical protein